MQHCLSVPESSNTNIKAYFHICSAQLPCCLPPPFPIFSPEFIQLGPQLHHPALADSQSCVCAAKDFRMICTLSTQSSGLQFAPGSAQETLTPLHDRLVNTVTQLWNLLGENSLPQYNPLSASCTQVWVIGEIEAGQPRKQLSLPNIQVPPMTGSQAAAAATGTGKGKEGREAGKVEGQFLAARKRQLPARG